MGRKHRDKRKAVKNVSAPGRLVGLQLVCSCVRCGADASAFEMLQNGKPVLSGDLCDDCLEKGLIGAELARKAFEALLAQGVDRAMANRIMIARIERGEYVQA